MIEDRVINTIKNGKHKHGSYNVFVKLSDKIGVKFNINKIITNEDYERQKHVSAYGLAPKVYRKVNFKIKGRVFYGYFTEVAVIFNYGDKNKEGLHPLIDGTFFDYDNNIGNLNKNLKNIGFHFWDHSLNNTGIINGKLVCIDFGVSNNNYSEAISFNEKNTIKSIYKLV